MFSLSFRLVKISEDQLKSPLRRHGMEQKRYLSMNSCNLQSAPPAFTIRTATIGLAVMLHAWGAPVSATTYFVGMTGNNANPGTARTNAWRTIQSAVDRVSPGDAVIVLAGAYTGAWIQRSGLPNSPITLKADDGAAVVLNVRNPSPYASRGSILWLEDWDGYGPVSYWIIQGFEIANAPRYGIDIRGSAAQPTRFITVISNRVHNSVVTGIFSAFSDDLLIVGNESYSNGEHGVYCSNSGDRPVVRGNRLHHNANCGLHMNGDVTAGGDGIISGGLVENNRIYKNGTGGSGINMDGVMGSRVQNNLIYASPNNSGIALFQQNGAVPSRNNMIINNTVIMNSNTTTTCGWGLTIANSGCVSNSILNNIFYSYHSFRGAIQIASTVIPGLICDYNAMESCFSTDNGYSTFTSFAAWKALGYDSNSIIATPTQLFLNFAADDYHLKTNSPGIDSGTAVAGMVMDIEGTPRPLDGSGDGTNRWDTGAYEYISEVSDSDNDGMKDRAEWIAGTDLLNSGSRLAINAISITAQGNSIMWWTSQVGRVYSILSGTNLVTGFVSQATNLSANAPMNVYTAAPSSSAEQFYKVSVTYPGH